MWWRKGCDFTPFRHNRRHFRIPHAGTYGAPLCTVFNSSHFVLLLVVSSATLVLPYTATDMITDRVTLFAFLRRLRFRWHLEFTALKHSDRRNNLAIVTSEPLTDRRADWMPVPEQVRYPAILSSSGRRRCFVLPLSRVGLLTPQLSLLSLPPPVVSWLPPASHDDHARRWGARHYHVRDCG